MNIVLFMQISVLFTEQVPKYYEFVTYGVIFTNGWSSSLQTLKNKTKKVEMLKPWLWDVLLALYAR